MKSILFRIIAVLMILVLIVNLSPIRARASALPEIAGVATKVIPFAKVVEPAALGLGGSIFCWVAAAIGVGFTVYGAVEAYNNFQDYSGMLETSIYYYPDGTWSYGVDMGFVERVRAFLFDTGVLIQSDSLYNNYSSGSEWVTYRNVKYRIPVDYSSFKVNYTYGNAHHFLDICLMHGSTTYYFSGATDPMTTSEAFEHNGMLYGIVMDRNYTADIDPLLSAGSIALGDLSNVSLGALSSLEYACKLILQGHLSGLYGSSVTSDYELGTVAPLEIPMPEAYPVWYTNSRPAYKSDTNEEVVVLPIPLNPSADPETQIGTLTQPDIWQGSVADPMPDTGTDADPDGSLSNTPWDAVKKWASDFFIPSGDITMYSLDLTELFPFCIPFDIFDLLSALKADPVAPVFELELDLGVTKAPITVDLSGWSDLASIVRILEIGLFCLGLALGTKELIGT